MDSNARGKEDANLLYGRWLSSPPPGDEVVISGISGRLPQSRNIHEFRDNLFGKKDMVTEDDGQSDSPEVLQRSARIYDIDKFDAGYFGIHYRQAHTLDPVTRIFLETTIEAVMDAGINPSELEGSKTGVFVSISFLYTATVGLCNITKPQQFGMTGLLPSFLSHRISYHLKLQALSCIVDTGCSSSLTALDLALKSIRSGQCDNAIVGGGNLLSHTDNTQFSRVGALSPDGKCKVFDRDADGFVRGEAVGCLFLQKAKNSKRIYAQIINTKVNSDGFKEQGVTFPSAQAQEQLLTELYEESGIDPSDLSYVEAHGTGTQAGDLQESKSIDRALATKRQESLLVGSVKSNTGHTEPASGICSLIKVLLAMETGVIAPNLHFKQIRKELKGFEEGRMKVVTELTDLKDEEALIGINNFGIGGTNAHVILKRFRKKKICGEKLEDDIPRLVCVSGRTEQSVWKLLDHVNTQSFDREYVGLLHQIYKKNISGHLYRGFTMVSKSGLTKTSVKFSANQRHPLYVHFGPMTKSVKILYSYFLKFSVFESTLSRINKIIDEIKKSPSFENVIIKTKNEFAQNSESLCLQFAIATILKVLEINSTAVYGDSYGKLVCAYYYGTLSLKQAIHAATNTFQTFSQPTGYVNMQVQPGTIPDILQNNFHNHQDLPGISKNSLLLNISDSRISDNDMLLVENGNVKFLQVLGSLYKHGQNPQLHKLYPEIKFPVSRGTSMVSPLIQWNYAKSWHVHKPSQYTVSDSIQNDYSFTSFDDKHKFLTDHVIDGRNLIPASEYLHLVWQTLAQSRGLSINEASVIFQNCRFIMAATMPANGILNIFVTIQRSTGNFEILEKKSILVGGTVHLCENVSQHQTEFEPIEMGKERTKILDKDEIYREMVLKGYNYSGVFKGIVKCNVEGTSGLIRWENNWTSYVDNMLQIRILKNDTSSLYVPTGIRKITIDPKKHWEIAKALDKQKSVLPVYFYEQCDLIKSGGVEIFGLLAKSVLKKKSKLKPVIEKVEFVPNCCFFELSEIVRINTQIILENSLETHFKAVEIIEDHTDSKLEPLSFKISEVLNDIVLVTRDLTISTKNVIEGRMGVKVDDVTLSVESNLLLIIASKVLRNTNFNTILKYLSKNGYVLTREQADFVSETYKDIEILTEYTTSDEKIILFSKSQPFTLFKYIEISSTNFGWLAELQTHMSNNNEVVLYCKNEQPEGMLGFISCVRREPNGKKIKCVFIMDDTSYFNPDDNFYINQIKRGLAVNVFKNNVWGTYRRRLLEKELQAKCEHCYANIKEVGNLSTLQWFEGPLTTHSPLQQDETFVSPYFAALNLKDVLIASGRVGSEIVTFRRRTEDCLIGFEFVGREPSGRRGMGMVSSGAISSLLVINRNILWEIPDTWSMEDAATVPIAYSTVISALFLFKPLKSGSSILIHSATGGVGLAALNVCLHHNCNIYVTVGTPEKRDYLKEHFPQIPESHFGNSRDTSFEIMIKKQTNNQGVDYVLNSLSDDKLLASVRCLARGGVFIEIGKYDLVENTSLHLSLLAKEASFHAISLDYMAINYPKKMSKIVKFFNDGIRAGFVKPLPRVVFDRQEIEKAHRHMMTGRHIGKVLVKIREEEERLNAIPKKMYSIAESKFYCAHHNSYIIVGGLGGVGLELAHWLVTRRATKLVLVSRFGIQNGYQKRRINILESLGVSINIFTQDVATKQGCINLTKEAQDLGPVDGVFNLAVVLKDALFEDQSEESFVDCLAPKVKITKYLDEVTRESCRDLKYFVVFSSAAGGFGNAGQTNYGMANSVMEGICERRKQDGLPALAIQWGPIGEVGIVGEMQKDNKDLVILGALPQKISSCLEVLDLFLKQDSPVVSSVVVARKHSREYGFLNAVEAVAYVLGIKDIKTVSQHSTLAELGMDSLTATEIRQILENDFGIYLTSKNVRSLTFAKLIEIEAEKNNCKIKQHSHMKPEENVFLPNIRFLSDSCLPAFHYRDETSKVTAFVFTGADGDFKPLETLAKQLKTNVLGVPYNYQDPEESIEEMAVNLIPNVESNLNKHETFLFVCYSFGALVGLEIISFLEKRGYVGHIVLIDGSPTYLKSSLEYYYMQPHSAESEFEITLVSNFLTNFFPNEFTDQVKDKMLKCISFNERFDLLLTLVPPEVANKQTKYLRALFKRIKAMFQYQFKHEKIKSTLHFFKAQFPIITSGKDSYEVANLCKSKGRVVTINGNHLTMLNQPELAFEINAIISNVELHS